MKGDRRPGSRLPEDPAYWDGLAARSVEAAFRSSVAAPRGLAVARARSGAGVDPWWRAMSDAAFVLAASAVIAVFGGSLLLQERSAGPAPEGHALTSALAPDDPLLVTLLNAPAAPPASALLKLVALREEER